MEDKPIKKVLVIIAKGTFNEVYQGLVLANGALMEGIKAELFFTFDGLIAVYKSLSITTPTKTREIMQSKNLPEISEFLGLIKESGGKLYGCKMSMEMLGIKAGELRDDLDGILSVGEFYDRAEKDSQIIFI